MCQVLHVVDFLGSRRMETAPTSTEVILRPTQSQSDEPSDLRGSLSSTSVYSTWQSQAVTHPIMNRASQEKLKKKLKQIPYQNIFVPRSCTRAGLATQNLFTLDIHRIILSRVKSKMANYLTEIT